MSSRIVNATGPVQAQNDFRSGAIQEVRRLYIAFMQGLFAECPPGNYRWTNDDLSEIAITDETPLNTSTVGKRPAVTITRGPVQAMTLGNDDAMDIDIQTGSKKKSVMLIGMMQINVCSRVDIEAENLAWFIAENIWMQRDLLNRSGFYDIGRGWVIGAPSPAGSLVANDSGDEWYVTIITSPFQFNRTSKITPLSQGIAEHLQVNASAGFDPSRSRQNLGPVDGYAIERSVDSGVSDTGNLRRIPHPLNPTQLVTVRPAHPSRTGLRESSIRPRLVSQSTSAVQQSKTESARLNITVKT